MACAIILVLTVLNAPTAKAVDPDTDGDGLTDDYEETTLYSQSAEASDLPTDVPDEGWRNATTTILPWSGLVNGGFANFTLDHSDVDEVTIQVGYWNGSAWDDRYLWDPGARLLGVEVISPLASTFLSGTVTVTATVPEDEVVDRVEFSLDGELLATVEDPSPSETYSFNWNTAGDGGDHQLVAVAIDTLGTEVSDAIPVKVDNEAPTVAITTPAEGALVGSCTIIGATAGDDYGVQRVMFYDGGDLVDTDYTAPYQATWCPSTSGSHTLLATAVDYVDRTDTDDVHVTADVTAPGVSFAAPNQGELLSATYHVEVQATDDIGLSKVEVRVDSGGYVDITDNFDGSHYWWDWDTTGYSSDGHGLTARATDQTQKSTTTSVYVTVDNAPPTVSITSPDDGDTVFGTVLVTASAYDSSGVDRVSFYINGAPVATDYAYPWEYSWNTAQGSGGNHQVKAKAWDLLGNNAQHQITVNVYIPPSCPPYCPMGPLPLGMGGIVLDVSTTATTPSFTVDGTATTVVADLLKGPEDVTQLEIDHRMLPTTFDPSRLHTNLTWRLVVHDWVNSTPSESQGTLQSFALRLEERSDPGSADTDGDGLTDGYEVNTLNTFPVAADTDGDGASDDFEAVPQSITVTIDGVPQGVEVQTDPTDADTDGDGLPDGEEFTMGMDRAVTNPVVSDTDGDGLIDGDEVTVYYSNATLTDTDGDGFADGTEVNPRSLNLTVNGTAEERSVTTLAYAEDSDGDGLGDWEEWYGTSVYAVVTDPSDPDTDGDGLPDGQERYVREASLPYRRTVNATATVDLEVSVSGPLEKAEVRYGLSTVDVSNFYLRLDKGSSLVLRDHEGSGLFNYSSVDITSSFTHGGLYSLNVTSDVAGGVLEEFALSFTMLTSPVQADSDGDGLNDSEEVTHGVDAWITDPNRGDTDGDGWEDDYEALSAGTSPLAVDTDGDGAADPADIDPLRNLLVQVTIKKVHHADPWCSPELLGIARINDDHAWVTEHRVADEDAFTSWLCPPPLPTTQYKTSSFFSSYYADVPDDADDVSVGVAAWSINSGRGDDLIVNDTTSYTLGSGTLHDTFSNNGHWISFDLSTTSLGKVHTLAVTDGNATVQAANGQVRYVAQDRYFVFLVNASYAYGAILEGMNALVVPRALYVASQLQARLDANTTYPLDDAAFYAENPSQAEMSEAVATVTAGNMSGVDAYQLLQYLLHNATGSLTSQAVDVTGYVPVLNLPTDALQIVPWEGVVNGPTGALPATFWQKVGAAATALVNVLVEAGQLIYGGLVALAGFFVALGEAIVAWGMALVGTVQAALQEVQAALEKVVDVLGALVDLFVSAVQAALQAILSPIEAWGSSVIAAAQELVEAALAFDGSIGSMKAMGEAIGSLIVTVFDPAITLVLSVAAIAIQVAILAAFITGIGAVVATVVVPLIISTIISVVLSAVAPAIEALLGWITDLVVQEGWLWAGMGIAILTLSSVLLSRISSPYEEIQMTFAPQVERWTPSFRYEVVGEKVPNMSGKAILFAIFSLAFAGFAILASTSGAPALVSVVIDVLAVFSGAMSARDALGGWDRYIFGRVTLILSGASLGIAAASLIEDSARAVSEA